jgi:hypothetical protein
MLPIRKYYPILETQNKKAIISRRGRRARRERNIGFRSEVSGFRLLTSGSCSSLCDLCVSREAGERKAFAFGKGNKIVEID